MATKKIVITDEPKKVVAPVEPEESSTQEELLADAPQPEPQVPFSQSMQAGASPKKARLLVGMSLLVIVAGLGIYVFLRPSNPLPKVDTQLATFKVYYPKPNGSNYTYFPGTSDYAAGKLTYTLAPQNAHPGAGGPLVRVSEQTLSGQGPDLNTLTGFTVFKVPAGNAAIGVNGTILNGVIVTKKTLIILNGLDGVSKQDFTQIIKSM